MPIVRTTMERIVLILALRLVFVLATCHDIEKPENARIVNASTYEVGSSVVFKCNEGYDMVGENELVCQNDGEWLPKPPSCQIKICGEFGSVRHGNTSQDVRYGVKNGYESIVHVTCDPGYVLDGPHYVKCQADGSWSERPVCVTSPCPPYPGMNSSCIEHSTMSTPFLFILCRKDVSVTRTGPDGVECINGQWEDNTIMACYCDCRVDADLELVSLDNAVGGIIGHTSTLDWSCKDRYIKNATEPLVCRDGKIGTPICVPGTIIEETRILSDKTADYMIVTITVVTAALAGIVVPGIVAYVKFRV